MKYTLIIAMFLLGLSHSTSAQEERTDLDYEVNKVYEPLSISRATLDHAETIYDLNPYFKKSWVRRIVEVEIGTIHDGKPVKIKEKSDVLTEKQKHILCTSDEAEDIVVKIKYIPENTLKVEEIHEEGYSFMVNPDKDASFKGGSEALMNYIKEKSIDKISVGSLQGYDIGAVKFSISNEGKVINVDFAISSGNLEVDDLILEAVRDMPDWIPAQYANGKKVQQDYVLMVGNLYNCNIPLLGVRKAPMK